MKASHRRKITYAACLCLLLLIITLGLVFRGKGPNATAVTGETQSNRVYSSGEENAEKEDYLSRYPVCTKAFAEIVARDKEELLKADKALDGLLTGTVGLLNQDAYAQGYSDFRAFLEDRVYKADFERLKASVKVNLQTILRGCDGERVRAERDEQLTHLSEWEYVETYEDEYRLSMFEEWQQSFRYALKRFDDARTAQRAENQIAEEYQKRLQSDEYDEEQLATLSESAAYWTEAVWYELGAEDFEQLVQGYLADCYAEFDAIQTGE